jgi:spore photoproduct lyase
MNSYGVYNNNFSHVYVEKEISKHPRTLKIIEKIKPKHIIYIDDYTHLFHRKNQNFNQQKHSYKLILAKKKYDFVYKASPMCEDYGFEHFFYSGMLMNCIFNCHYCYLKSLYDTSNIVYFVNTEDCLKNLEEKLKRIPESEKVLLALSYESDLLALNPVLGEIEQWIEFAHKHPEVTFEIKTKSGDFTIPKQLKIPDNIIFAWSMLPREVIDMYEEFTPKLQQRYYGINKAIKRGVKVRVSIEPLMNIENFEKIYYDFLLDCFYEINVADLVDVNIGVFRMSSKQFKKFSRNDPYSPVFAYSLEKKENYTGYIKEDKIKKYIEETIKSFVPEEKVILY